MRSFIRSKKNVGVAYCSRWGGLLAPGDKGWASSLVVKYAVRNWVVGGSILSAAWAALVAIVGRFWDDFGMTLRCFFWTSFCHELGTVEVSEALDATVRTAKMRSTIQTSSCARAQIMMKKRKYFLERFGTLFWHYFDILEVSGVLNGTNRKLSARSTIWE